jgi:hypothetical protein
MYQVENPMDKAMGGMDKAAGTYGSMDKDIPANRDPGPTPGGAINAGMGGAVAAASIGSAMGTGAAAGIIGGPPGIAIGAALGIGAYLLS